MIKFAYTIFYVKDVAETITFYEKAFGLTRKFISEKNEYGELITGETTLSFASLELAKTNVGGGITESDTNAKPFAMEIAFSTDDVDRAVETAVRAGATLVEKPKVKPWGQTVAYLKDINGFLVEICTPVN